VITLYFYRGRLAPAEAAQAKRLGARTRDALAVTDRDFIERCDRVAGAVPRQYEHLPRADLPDDSSIIPAQVEQPSPEPAKRGRKRKGEQ